MDTEENKEEYCIVNVGRAVGKVKYALLDKEDAQMARHYVLRAQLLVDANGNGAKVFVLALPRVERTTTGVATTPLSGKPQLLQDIVWQSHNGEIPNGYTVVHCNDVPVDNRLANLRLKSLESCTVVGLCDDGSDSSGVVLPSGQKQCSVYWTCVSQLPLGSLYENVPDSCFYRTYAVANGLAERASHSLLVPASPYYECHFLPCTSLERQMLEFRMCGRCREVRYCSVTCQELDWAVHRMHCRQYVPLTAVTALGEGHSIDAETADEPDR